MSYWILDFLPIPLGICAFLVIKSLRISIDRIKIIREDDADAEFLERIHDGFHKQPIHKSCASGKKLIDLAIISGNFVEAKKLNRVGIISRKGSFLIKLEVRALARAVLKAKTDKITILASDNPSLRRFVLRYSKVSGTLIWYALFSDVETVCIWGKTCIE